MPSWRRVNTPELPEIPAFAHAAVAGEHIYVSGMFGWEPQRMTVVDGGVAAETTVALQHVERILAACDASLADIVKVTVYLTDMADWDEMNRAYVGVLGASTPARIAVGCTELVFGASVEFDCVAWVEKERS